MKCKSCQNTLREFQINKGSGMCLSCYKYEKSTAKQNAMDFLSEMIKLNRDNRIDDILKEN